MMDDELVRALDQASVGRMCFVPTKRTLYYTSPLGTTVRALTGARELRSLMQLLMLVQAPTPDGRTSLEVAAELLLGQLDARPELAARGLAHVRALAARSLPTPIAPPGMPAGVVTAEKRRAANVARPVPEETSVLARDRAS